MLKQIHLDLCLGRLSGRLWRSGDGLPVHLIEIGFQLAEILAQGGKQIALMQGCRRMEKRKHNQILMPDHLPADLGDTYFAFQNRFRRPPS